MSDREHLADVYEAIRADRAFDHLRTPGIVLVPGVGASRPRIMIVGGAPGATENTDKMPFRGTSGGVLRSLLNDAAGLSQDDLFLTHVLKYRTPNNRAARRGEVYASVPYLRREWDAIGGPLVMVSVGSVAFSALRPAGETRDLIECLGIPLEMSGGKALWPMMHPRLGLANPGIRPLAEKHWEDFGAWFRKEFL